MTRSSAPEPAAAARRRGRTAGIVTVAIAVPALLVSAIGIGAYASWESSRIDVPDVVGRSAPEAIEALTALGIEVEGPRRLDPALPEDCAVVTAQSLPAGERVGGEDARIALGLAPAERTAPDVTGLSLAEAREVLREECLRLEPSTSWCPPEGFAPPTDVLAIRDLRRDTGFSSSPTTGMLTRLVEDPAPSWVVCGQPDLGTGMRAAGSAVEVSLAVPLTAVPEITGIPLAQASSALSTGPECELLPRLLVAFDERPEAMGALPLPSAEDMRDWTVTAVSPAVGRTVVCGSRVELRVAWPQAEMPQLLGLAHLPGVADGTTATRSALADAGLVGGCSGRGVVTGQDPAPGTPLPVGTTVRCTAELVMPSIVGLAPEAAAATLAAAGIEGTGTGSGIVVSQTPEAGTIVAGPSAVTYRAEQPKPAPVSSGGGGAYYQNCSAARAAGAAPILAGEPGYRPGLDRDGDGIACE